MWTSFSQRNRLFSVGFELSWLFKVRLVIISWLLDNDINA